MNALTRAMIVGAGVCGLVISGCGEGEREAERAQQPAERAPAPAASFEVSRDTAEQAAMSIRHEASTSEDPGFIASYLDPAQATTASKFLGGSLIFYARAQALRDAAVGALGEDAAPVVDRATMFYTVQLENGLREMFAADRFEEVRRAGPMAYVMATRDDGQPMGDAIVFRDNQGEWLLLLTTGDELWADARLGQLAGALAGPSDNAAVQAIKWDGLIERLRAGSVDSVEALRRELGFDEGVG